MFACLQTALSSYTPDQVITAKRFNNMIVVDNQFEDNGFYYIRGDGKNFSLPSNLQRGALNMELCPFKQSATYENYTRCLAEFDALPAVELVFGKEVHVLNIIKNDTVLENATFTRQGERIHVEVDFQGLEYKLRSEDYEENVFVTCTCSNATRVSAFAAQNFTAENGHISADFSCAGFDRLAPYVKDTKLMDDERIKTLMTLGGKLAEACRKDADGSFETCKMTVQDRHTDRAVSTGEVQLKRNKDMKAEL